jgi:hypothetical protein
MEGGGGSVLLALGVTERRRRTCASAKARAGSGQLRHKGNTDGTTRGRGLSPCGCPSDVAAALCSSGHVVTSACQVASAQGRLHSDEGDISVARCALGSRCLKKKRVGGGCLSGCGMPAEQQV